MPLYNQDLCLSIRREMPSLTSVHRQDDISSITPLLPPQSAAPNISSRFITTFRLPCCAVVLYFCSSYIFALPFAMAYTLLWTLGSLILDTHQLLFKWTFFELLSKLWFLFFILGNCIEVLTYAGWLLLKVIRKREDSGDQKYRILARRVWQAASITVSWSMEKYIGLLYQIGRIPGETKRAWTAQVD